MHFEDIKALLRKRGSSAAGVARDLAVSKQAVSDVLRGTKVSRRVALAISQRVGVPVQRLWPGKYPHLELEQLAASRGKAGACTPSPAQPAAEPAAAIHAAIHQATATRAAKAPRAPRRA
ncbi:MAG: helix-turn-helix domain-containing protein [Burkholderiales bacterium]|nr:helix-turn-helix domain-containing protein [Burkholderiales bacterium]